MVIEIIIFILTTLVAYYLYAYKKIHRHFDKHGIKYSPGVPVFGNVFNSTVVRKHVIEDLDAAYKAFPGERYVGYADGTKPVILIRDPELVKLITVKDFDHFINRKVFFPKEIAPLLASSLIMMEGESWREMRKSLSPSYTGSKMRQMVPFMSDVCTNIVEYLKDHQSEDLDALDLMRRYLTDVIISTTMGMQVNSVKNPDNKFFEIAQETVRFSLKKQICLCLSLQSRVLTKIMQFLNIGIISMESMGFFREVVANVIEYRQKNNVIRPDFIHLLMETSKEWTPDEIAGQVYFAFLAGFENASSSLTLCIHELAINPCVQEKLYQEIRANQKKNGVVTYDDINQLEYLDCVFNENARKWSSATMLSRVCTKPYVLPPPREGGKPYHVNRGDMIYNAVNPVHMDPQYYPDPTVFNPERFSDKNKHKIKPFTFMPFGTGPRNCLGMRFATLMIKVMLYHLVLNYKIIKCDKTATPIRLMANVIHIKAIGGTWVQFLARN